MADKLDLFKQAATEMGYKEDEVNAFLDSVESAPPSEQFQNLAESSGFTEEEIAPILEMKTQEVGGDVFDESFAGVSQSRVTPQGTSVTTPFGARSGADVFSGGINYGVDLAVSYGTMVALPPEGQWEVVEAFGGANPQGGYVGNATNRGYGNSVLVRNLKTGEKLRYSHLSNVGVKPGQIIKGGEAIGKSGNSGNSTSAHLDLEAYDVQGKITDPMKRWGTYL